MIKNKMIFILCLFCSISVFAESSTFAGINAGLLVQPYSEPVPGNNHFAPATKPFGGDFAMWVSGTYGATFPISLGDHPIFEGSFIRTTAEFTLTPVTASPRFDVTFSPLPFLYFNAGATIGASWIFGNELLVGIKTYDKVTEEYTARSAFSSMYFDAYIQGNFQFDLAVFLPGDWNHIVTLVDYKVGYTGLTSGGDGTPWGWLMTGSEKANGLNYSATAILAYQMPLVLQMVGFRTVFGGYFFENDFNTESHDWDPTFMGTAINLFAILKIEDNHAILMQSGFSTRRSFDKEYEIDVPIVERKAVGKEWYFNGITILYTYTF